MGKPRVQRSADSPAMRIGICFACGVIHSRGEDRLSWDTLARLDRTVLLYQCGALDMIVCTGGLFVANQRVPAATLMKAYLQSRGIPPSRIIIEARSVDSMENVAFSLAIHRRRGQLRR